MGEARAAVAHHDALVDGAARVIPLEAVGFQRMAVLRKLGEDSWPSRSRPVQFFTDWASEGLSNAQLSTCRRPVF